MGIRKIVVQGDPLLNKRCRPVTDFNKRLHNLLDDLKDTLAQANGVGLAAPQVGVLRRAVVVLETNVPEGEPDRVIELVNPQIIDADGEQDGPEGCLSVPGSYGMVKRPSRVRVKAQDRNGSWFEAEGTGLTARAFCHEIDHLDGHLFTELCDHILSDEELSAYYGSEGNE